MSKIPRNPPSWSQLEAKYKADIDALTVSAEMATIDKEIAEEKLDNYEREIQSLKERLSEAEQQINTVGQGTTESTVTVYQLQKAEERNELLEQALMKLRDISANDKKELEDLQLSNQELQVKILDFEEREHKNLERIKIFEEQIDVSQNAQEMVEKLTQQKTDLEDKMREMADELEYSEKLRDLNEELLENSRETEKELNAQLDNMRVQFSELQNKIRNLEDYLLDRERTMLKFKEENSRLQDQLSQLKDQFKEGESIEQQRHDIENVAYKLTFSESKMAEKEAEIARYRKNLTDMEEQMNNLSSITKEQSLKLEELKMQLDSKVSETLELQRALKRKMEELSQLEIRRDMAEKKLQALQKEMDTKLSNMNRTIETMKGMEVQHEEDIKRLMEDYEMVERDRRELRDQLNRSNRSLERSMQTGLGNHSMVTAHDTSLTSLGISFQTLPSSQISLSQSSNTPASTQPVLPSVTTQVPLCSTPIATPRQIGSIPPDTDDSVLIKKIRDLGSAFDLVNRRNYDLELELAMNQLNTKIPPKTFKNIGSYYDIERAKTLQSDMLKLKRKIRASMIEQTICPTSRRIMSHLRNEKFNESKLCMQYQRLEEEASALMSSAPLSRFRSQVPLLQSTPVK